MKTCKRIIAAVLCGALTTAQAENIAVTVYGQQSPTADDQKITAIIGLAYQSEDFTLEIPMSFNTGRLGFNAIWNVNNHGFGIGITSVGGKTRNIDYSAAIEPLYITPEGYLPQVFYEHRWDNKTLPAFLRIGFRTGKLTGKGSPIISRDTKNNAVYGPEQRFSIDEHGIFINFGAYLKP